MTKKKKTDLQRQLEIIKRNKLNPALYVVVNEQETRLIVKHRITGDIKVIDK